MSFDDVPSRLEDILKATQEIQQFISGKSFDGYRHDTMLRLAIERCVEIVSEASRHIPADLKAGHPEVPWQNVADIGNILRRRLPSDRPALHVGGCDTLAQRRPTDAHAVRASAERLSQPPAQFGFRSMPTVRSTNCSV